MIKRALLGAVLGILVVGTAMPSSAQSTAFSEDFVATFRKILVQAMTVTKFKKACDEKLPDTAATNTPLLENWERANSMRGVSALAANLANLSPNFQREIAGLVPTIEEKTRKLVDLAPQFCTKFSIYLQVEENKIMENNQEWFGAAKSKLPRYFDQ